jgi:N-acetylglucosaminyldiphosphoundecaprenol N-acetyl-beta-D-mannosaminyltransferase
MRRVDLFGVRMTATDYEEAADAIVDAARSHRSYGVSALAVHGLVEAIRDRGFRKLVNEIDLVVPDGQPVRWAMNRFLGAGLPDRVYGPRLTEIVCAKAEQAGVSIYLYGSTEETIGRLERALRARFPFLQIAGLQADRFRDATCEEDEEDVKRINDSRAGVVLVGRGCPRQEIWVARHKGKVNAAMMAVGAAFDFLSGTKPQAPAWMQDNGLEWLFRLVAEPRRLWKRYLVSNSLFVWYCVREVAGGARVSRDDK